MIISLTYIIYERNANINLRIFEIIEYILYRESEKIANLIVFLMLVCICIDVCVSQKRVEVGDLAGVNRLLFSNVRSATQK